MSLSDTEQAQSTEPMITEANDTTEPVNEENGVVEMETESDDKGMCISYTSTAIKNSYILINACDNSCSWLLLLPFSDAEKSKVIPSAIKLTAAGASNTGENGVVDDHEHFGVFSIIN